MTQTNQDFRYSNLSKIKPKLRTTGNLTGNFGRPKVREGSNNQLGMSKSSEGMNITTPDDYMARMLQARENTTDPKLLEFIDSEIERLTPMNETRLQPKVNYKKGTHRREF